MKKNLLNFIILLLFVSSCAEKTIPLANGKMVTEKQFDRRINSSFRHANRVANKSMRDKLSRKQRRELWNTTIEVQADTTQ